MLSRNEWESNFFSRRIFSLDVNKWDSLTFKKCVDQSEPELIEARISLEDSLIICELVLEKFVIADTTLDFSRHIGSEEISDDCTYETAGTEHIAELKQIAKESLVYSRFDDDFFGPNAKERIYMEWVANAVKGEFDDVCLIGRVEGHIAGFITCRKEAGTFCRVGLMAVDNRYQGKGVGRTLMEAAVSYANNKNFDVLKVSTQYGNHSAIGFYSKAGFKIETIDLWLYRF